MYRTDVLMCCIVRHVTYFFFPARYLYIYMYDLYIDISIHTIYICKYLYIQSTCSRTGLYVTYSPLRHLYIYIYDLYIDISIYPIYICIYLYIQSTCSCAALLHYITHSHDICKSVHIHIYRYIHMHMYMFKNAYAHLY